MKIYLRLIALFTLILTPILSLAQPQLPAAAQGMTPEQVQQATQGMSPSQIRQATEGMSPKQIQQVQQATQGMSPSQIRQATEGMSPKQIQQIQQAMSPDAIQNLPAAEAPPGEASAPKAAAEDQTESIDIKVPAEESTEAEAAISKAAAVSNLEHLYRTNYGSPLAVGLTQFGYDLFKSPSTATPSRLAVPDPAYVLGPGDSLRIRIWGSGLDAEYTGSITKEGNINVPKIGIVPVAGLKYGQVEGVIREAAEKYVQGINISVSLDQLRSIEIYVVGSVRQPGLRLVPAFSTVLGGLMAGGGVEKSGSLRNIKLFRNSNLHRVVDIYDLILRGSRKADVILKDRDVIFVPRIGPTMAVAGAVAEPGIYELKGEDKVGQVLTLAGDVLPQSYTGRMYLRRFDNNYEFKVKDIDTLKGDGGWPRISVQNGDFLEVQLLASIRPMTTTVRLIGHVWMPDIYQYRPGLKLSEILYSPDLLKPEAMTDYAILSRYDEATTRTTTHKFPLQQVLDGTYDAELQPLDVIQILSRAELRIRETVEIFGAVWRPIKTTYRPQMTLNDLMALAGGLREDQAFMDYGYLYRYDPAILDFRLQRISLQNILASKEVLSLQPFDRIRILNRIDFDMRYTVTLAGAVWKPATYDFNQGVTLSDLINIGGGIKFGADTDKISLTRKKPGEDRMDAEHQVLNMDQSGDFELQPYDYVFVPQLKDANLVRQVNLKGEVRYPGTYTIRENERISELIDRAGGFTREAYYYGTQYQNENARITQQKSLEKLLDDLEIRAKVAMSQQAQTGSSSEDIEAAKASQVGIDAFIKKLRAVKAKGRVAIKIADMESFRGSEWDFVLEDGDTLTIPPKPSFVSVVGSVYSPSSYIYQLDQTLGDYLEQAGGPTKTADKSYIYLLKANGEVLARKQSGTFFSRFNNQRLMPGDTIVVPENLERIPYLRLIKDISDITFKIATTVGVAIALW